MVLNINNPSSSPPSTGDDWPELPEYFVLMDGSTTNHDRMMLECDITQATGLSSG